MSRTKKRKRTGSKAFDPSCRNNKGCPWCESNRTASNRRREASAESKR